MKPIFAVAESEILRGLKPALCRLQSNLNHIVQDGDVLIFPKFEDMCIYREDFPNGKYRYYGIVYRNGRFQEILLKEVTPPNVTYSLNRRFGFCDDDLPGLLEWLGNRRSPIHVTDCGICF